jgi:hypothetical protein
MEADAPIMSAKLRIPPVNPVHPFCRLLSIHLKRM